MKFSTTTIATFSLLFGQTNANMLRSRATTVCSWSQIREFDCDIRDDVVGVYVCRAGTTRCVDPIATIPTDTCGCCAGDTRLVCIDDGDMPSPALPSTTVASANGVCSAFQVAEFDCDIVDDVVGVFVCRGGATKCVLAGDTISTDTCGCCPGDTRRECLDVDDDDDDDDKWN